MPQWNIEFKIHAPIKLAGQLLEEEIHAAKELSEQREVFTTIKLRAAPNERHMRRGFFSVIFTAHAASQKESFDAGKVYASQLCDLLSLVTGVRSDHEVDEGTQFSERMNARFAPTSDRILKVSEWKWIVGSLPQLQQKEPKFMSACSWFRRGLCGDEITEKLCCFWRVIERCANSYGEEDRSEKGTRAIVEEFINLTFDNPPPLLADKNHWNKVYDLRNTISHGKKPLSPKLIEECGVHLGNAEESSFKTLHAVADQFREKYSLGRLLEDNLGSVSE